MKPIKYNHIFQIVYPLVVYFAIYQIGAYLLYSYIGLKFGYLVCMAIAALVCLIPIIGIYNRVPHLIPYDNITSKEKLQYLLWVIGVVALGLVVNVIITKSGFIENSDNFSHASAVLTDGILIIKILCNAIIIPILEEVLIRGIIAGQLCLWQGPIFAVLISSICFGILHNNSVQFLYALIIGFALGTMYVQTKRLSLCILTHGLINFFVIIFANL